MPKRPLGKRQRELLTMLCSNSRCLVVGDDVSKSLVRRGLLAAEPDGCLARITPAGLRRVADEMEAGRIKGFSIEQSKAKTAGDG